MKYTKEQLQAMRNFELSEILCGLLGYEVKQIYPCHQSEMPTVLACTGKPDETSGAWFAVEFGRWDCIMPLAVEHKLSLMPTIADDWEWQALKNNMVGVSHYYTDANPLRAIACCLILVLQDSKA